MQVIIIDTSGSVTDTQIEEGTAFANELMADLDNRGEIVCLTYCGNIDNHKVIFLENIIDNFRALYKQCTITLITDGMLTTSQAEAVDNIYVYQDFFSLNKLEYCVKDKLCGTIPILKSVQ